MRRSFRTRSTPIRYPGVAPRAGMPCPVGVPQSIIDVLIPGRWGNRIRSCPNGVTHTSPGQRPGIHIADQKNVGLDHHSTDRRIRSNCTRISGASFNSTRGLSSLRIWSQSRPSPWRTRTFSMSIQSLERPAKAFRTTRSSAWHTWREIPGKNSRNIALRHNDSSNGNPASATSMGMPSDVFRRSTRRSSANSAASGIRGANLERNA